MHVRMDKLVLLNTYISYTQNALMLLTMKDCSHYIWQQHVRMTPDLKVIQFLLKCDPNSVSRTVFIDPENSDSPQRYNQYLPLHYAVQKGADMKVIRYLFDVYPEALHSVVTRVMLVHDNMFHTAAIEFFRGQLEAIEHYRDHASPLIRAIQSDATLGECSVA